VTSVAYAPVRYDGRLIGVLAIHATGTEGTDTIAEGLPAVVEFADLAGALIGRDVLERTEAGVARRKIRSIIDRRAFRTVFQPIVELASGDVVAYEALTRFGGNAGPELVFGQAAAVGLGVELEAATLGASLAAAEVLPADLWLNFNVSPDLVISPEPLRSIVRSTQRQLVLEVTEHTAIADYAALRTAVADLERDVQLAVDDAGAGFASLRHILELRPGFVKLDRGLIGGLEADEARQAMIAGMRHFAQVTGCRLIAEGVETEAELRILRDLDVHLGQGYLLGRPGPINAGPPANGRSARGSRRRPTPTPTGRGT
jgi:EAL domain-containing protein (putative c-di-GMP-specific phosphodiesterase class I)